LTEKIIYSIYGLTIYAPGDIVSSSAREQLESGLYELDETGGIRDVLDPEAPVIELGAGIGVVSCFINRLLAEPARHIAVEMHPGAYTVLEQNRVLNGARFDPVLATIQYDDKRAALHQPPAEWDPSNRLFFQSGPPATTLGKLADDAGWPRFNLVADVEGMELPLLEQELDLLRERVVTINIELHPHVFGPRQTAGIVHLLQANGFRLEAVAGGCVFGFRRHGGG
jgi:FkbM family methyltransferase